MNEEFISDLMSQSYSEVDKNLVKQSIALPVHFAQRLSFVVGLHIEAQHIFPPNNISESTCQLLVRYL